MKDWRKEIGVAFFGNFLLIGIYMLCTYDNWYDPTNLFSEIMFFGAFFGFPIIIFAIDFYMMAMLSKWLKIKKTKRFFLKLLAYNIAGFLAFHSLLTVHGQLGNRYMGKNVEKYVFEGDKEQYSFRKLAELEKELGYDLQYIGSTFSTGFHTGTNQIAGSLVAEEPVRLKIRYKVSDSACTFDFCEGTQVYDLQYEKETFEEAVVDIPLRERYVLAGIEGDYQKENENNYFYKITVDEDYGYSPGVRSPLNYEIKFDELSASGYWNKEADNFSIYTDDEFPDKKITGTVSTVLSGHLQHVDGKNASVRLEGSKLVVQIEGQPPLTYYRK